MNLPSILSEYEIDDAAQLLADYYANYPDGRPRWTGSRFNNWAGGGDSPATRDQLSADDLVSVTFLSVKASGRAAIGLLEWKADEISALLASIPVDLDLNDVPADRFEDVLGQGSTAHRLWHVLRGTETGRWDIGPTTASKLMARKRPRLIPIYDSVVGPLMGLEDSTGQWERWHEVLTDNTGLPQRLTKIHGQSGISDPISRLRVMDIVLWMHGRKITGSEGREEAPVSA